MTTTTDLTTKMVQKMLRKWPLTRVEIIVSLAGVHARAIPDGFHPKVTERREAAFAAREGSISLQEAEAITRDSLSAVAAGQGETIEAALAALQAAMTAS